MQDQAAAARLPLRLRGVFAQSRDMLPRHAAIAAAEQPRRLDPGVKLSVLRREAPYRLDRFLVSPVGKPFGRACPRRAEIGGFPDRSAEPSVAAARVNCAVSRIGNDVVDRPGLAEWTAQFP
jgi:hypothetical protein